MIHIGWGGSSLGMDSEKAPLRDDVSVETWTMGRHQPCEDLEGAHSRQRKEQMESLRSKNMFVSFEEQGHWCDRYAVTKGKGSRRGSLPGGQGLPAVQQGKG